MMRNRSVEEIHIENLSKKRYEFIQKRNDAWDEVEEKYTEEFPEINTLGDEIYKYIKMWRYALPFEFIIEELTKLGHAPNLLYDDDGRFAITGNGMQTVPMGEAIDMEMFYLVPKDQWKNSIREALDNYLDDEE